jgi:hemoglobin
MMTKNLTDIEAKSDIETLVNVFYEQVKNDKQISCFFDQVNWEMHLPIMYNFWENVLFYTGNYTGNPMLQHKLLNERMPLSIADFERWIYLFNKTVDKLYKGSNADLIKEKANSIASVMQIKILN